MAATTWDVNPEWEYATTRRRRIERTPSSSGFIARRSVWPQSQSRRSFLLVWKQATDAQIARLRQIWSQCKGAADTITYTPIDGGGATTVRFSGDGLRIVRRSTMMHEASVELVEDRQ